MDAYFEVLARAVAGGQYIEARKIIRKALAFAQTAHDKKFAKEIEQIFEKNPEWEEEYSTCSSPKIINCCEIYKEQVKFINPSHQLSQTFYCSQADKEAFFKLQECLDAAINSRKTFMNGFAIISGRIGEGKTSFVRYFAQEYAKIPLIQFKKLELEKLKEIISDVENAPCILFFKTRDVDKQKLFEIVDILTEKKSIAFILCVENSEINLSGLQERVDFFYEIRELEQKEIENFIRTALFKQEKFVSLELNFSEVKEMAIQAVQQHLTKHQILRMIEKKQIEKSALSNKYSK